MITSRQNPTIKQIYQLARQKKARSESSRYLIENPKHLFDLQIRSPDAIETVIYDHRFNEIDQVKTDAKYEVPPQLLDTVSPLPSPSGIIAVIKKPIPNTDMAIKHATAGIILDHVSDPKNVGAVIRNAAAFGINLIVLSNGCADPYHPESVRASAGLVDTLPILEWEQASIQTSLNATFDAVALDPHAPNTISPSVLPERPLFIFGSEGQGIHLSAQSFSRHQSLKIPINADVESLNIAVSSAIVFWTFAQKATG